MYVDSSTLFHAWNGQSARSHSLSEALKSIFEALMSTNCILRLFQVPSVSNLADRPSRSLSLSLSLSLWRIPVCLPVVGSDYKTRVVVQMVIQLISWLFRPMSFARRLVQCCRSFHRTLPRVALALICSANLPTFIHVPHLFSYPYIFPPICLIPNVIRFMSSFAISFTVVVPDVLPRRFWWALLPHCPSSSLLLAREGQVGVLHAPSKNGFQDSWPLSWAFRIEPI